MIHGATIGEWTSNICHETDYHRCDVSNESQAHCLCECPVSKQIWLKLLHLMALIGTRGSFTWEIVLWASLNEKGFLYEQNQSTGI
jgi:hypothetical protein